MLLRYLGKKTPDAIHKTIHKIQEEIDQKGPSTYIEPFVGTGEILNNLSFPKNTKLILNDSNKRIVDFLTHVKTNCDELIYLINGLSHELYNNLKEYERIKDEYNRTLGISSPLRSSQYYYLLSHAHMNEDRVNQQGFFNKAFYFRKSNTYFDGNNLKQLSIKLNELDAQILNFDIIDFFNTIKPTNALIVCDPPYLTLPFGVKENPNWAEKFKKNGLHRFTSTTLIKLKESNLCLCFNSCNEYVRREYQLDRVPNKILSIYHMKGVRTARKEMLFKYV